MKLAKDYYLLKHYIFLIAAIALIPLAHAQTAMTNIESRNKKSLDGEWKVIIDPTGVGEWRQLWNEKTRLQYLK